MYQLLGTPKTQTIWLVPFVLVKLARITAEPIQAETIWIESKRVSSALSQLSKNIHT